MNKKILLINPNRDDLDVMVIRLRRAGFDQCLTATSGFEGLVKAIQQRPSVIIFNAALPEYGVAEFCRKIRFVLKFSTKIIVLGYAIQNNHLEFPSKSLADDYILLENDFYSLTKSLEKVLDPSVAVL